METGRDVVLIFPSVSFKDRVLCWTSVQIERMPLKGPNMARGGVNSLLKFYKLTRAKG
jgi:hypothetical protein